MYGFIYITTNKINNKKYLGQKKFDSCSNTYLGSGRRFKLAVKKYGKENFERTIIQFCSSPDELNQAEYDWSKVLNVVESDDWYNEVYGGKKMYGYHFSEESKRKNSEAHKGKYPTEETRKKLSESQKGRKSWNKGLHHTEEARKKMSEARKGKFGEQHNRSIKVVRVDSNGNEICFGSIREAERHTGINRSTIQYHIKNTKSDKNGYVWLVRGVVHG